MDDDRRPPGAPPVFDAAALARATRAVLSARGDDAAALAARQARRLARLARWARERSPLYRARLRGVDPARTPLADWPVVTKPELMARFADWVTDPALDLAALRDFTADPARIADAFAGRWQVWESSGSSGEPGVFVQDTRAMALYDALEALRRPHPRPLQPWLDPLGLGERWAFVGAIGGHFASIVSARRLQRLNPWLAPRMRCLSLLQPAAALAAELDAWRPTVLATYPSAAAMLADEAAAGRLRCRPRELWTGGETLSPAVRRHVEAVLGCRVCNSYGSSEFLASGWQCDRGALHLNTDWALLEPVDAQHRPVPPGTPSHTTLLTHLGQYSQPLIRYDLGDRLTLDPRPCACGSPLPVAEVQGRCDDVLVMAGPHGRPVSLLPLALVTVLEDEAGLFDFTLRQADARTLHLGLPADLTDRDAALARGLAVLQRFCAAHGLDGARLSGEGLAVLPRGRSGKAQRIVACPPASPASGPAR